MATVAEIPDDNIADIQDYKSNSLWRLTLRRLFRQRSALIGLSILVILVFTAVFAPLVAPHDPTVDFIGEENSRRRDPPCIHALGCDEAIPQHIFGLDGNARDLFSRIVYGTRISLGIGLIVVTVASVSGTLLGALAGYMGGWVDNLNYARHGRHFGVPCFVIGNFNRLRARESQFSQCDVGDCRC